MNFKKRLLSNDISLAVWGTGYIGLSSMVYFAEKGVRCLGYDIDDKKVKSINKGVLTIPELKNWFNIDIRKLSKNSYLKATSNYKNLISDGFPVHLIAIPTEKNGKPYFKILFYVLDKISTLIKKKIRPVIIVESTLTPKFTRKFIIPYLSKKGHSENDYILGIAPRRDWFVENTKSLVEIAQIARMNDATVVGITSADSPLAQECSYVLSLEVPEDTDMYMPMASRIAQLTLIDVLATGFTLRRGNKFRENLKRVKDTLRGSRFEKRND